MIALVMTQEEMTKVIMEIQEVILQKLDIMDMMMILSMTFQKNMKLL